MTETSLVLFASDRFADHVTPPGHPERVGRAEVMQTAAAAFARGGGAGIEPRPVTAAERAAGHPTSGRLPRRRGTPFVLILIPTLRRNRTRPPA